MANNNNLFDELDELSAAEKVKPFHVILKENKEDSRLQWLNRVKNALLEQSQTRTMQQRMHLAQYRGVAVNKWDRRREYNGTRRLTKINRFIVNHLYDLTETKVSQMTRLKPAVEVLPANDEWEDRASAKVVGLLIKHLWTINNADYLMQQMHRHCRIFGESYAFVTWDKNLGDLAPEYVEARDAGLDEITLSDGSTVDISKKKIMTGDVKYDIEIPWRVLLQRKTRYDQVEYVFRVNVTPVDDLKEQYPNKKNKIMSNEDVQVFDVENLDNKFLEEHTAVFEFFHKATEFVPNGYYAKFTKDVILEEGDLPYTHGKLPMVRLTDLDVPEMLNGVSRYESISQIQKMHDNIGTLIAKNIYLTAHAKWLMPRGACKIEQLGNDNTIIQYQGPVAPQLAQVHSNPPEVYAFRQQLKEEMQTVYGSHGISRGEVPKGITASSALQFLNELETDRASTDIAKHGFLVKDLAKLTIAVTGDYYDINDGRMVRVVGENNKFLIRHFDAANLNKDYDIRYDNSTGLPEAKASRTQRILDTMQRNPTLFSPERWEELLELGNTERMAKLSTEAIKAADSENEDLLAGVEVAMPEEWEDHIAHWESHVRNMQSRAFKEEATPEVVAAMKDHVYWTEELMMEKMGKNPLFQAKIAELKLFPLFFHESGQVPLSAEHQAAMVQGQTNRGEPVSGNIPGNDVESQRDNASRNGNK